MPLLSEALTAYRVAAKAEGRSSKTISWVADAVRYFGNFLGKDADVLDISAADLRGFIAALQEKRAFSNHRLTTTQNRPLSPAAVASYTRAIRSFFSFLERDELISENKLRKVRLPKVPRRVMPVFSEAELQRLLRQPDRSTREGYRDYAVMLTLLDTGIRVSELCGLRVGDVDLESSRLQVMGKGGKERYAPVGSKLARVLVNYRVKMRPADAGSDSFFLTADGRPLSKKRVQDRIRSYGRRAGIRTRCSPHTFRSTSAVLYLRNGGDPFTLQEKLGHSTLAMTRRYSVLADSDVMAAHAKYSPVDRLNL